MALAENKLLARKNNIKNMHKYLANQKSSRKFTALIFFSYDTKI